MSRKKTQNNANIILERICERNDLHNDEEIAGFFLVAPSTVSSWRTRNAPPYDLIHAKCRKEDIPYITTGQEGIAQVGKEKESTEFIQVKKIKTPLSGGGGTVTYYDELGHEYSFRQDWIRKHCPGNNCALFNVSGDSMAPEITDGDIVLVDMSPTAKNTISDGKIYAFYEGDWIFVKRLERRGTEIWAVPRNAKEYRIKDEDHFSVIGRVIWVGHEVK